MESNSKLIGHDHIFNNLKELYLNKKLPNIILLSGKKGIGKFLLASHCVNFMLSQDEIYKYDLKNFEINNQNKSYILFKNNIHPNIFLMNKSNDKKFIEILQIREMIKFQNNSSFNNKNKFIIIDSVNDLNINSTNSLLKSIEEPNNNLFFLLTKNSGYNIQNTLKSRCLEFKLYLTIKEVKLIVDNYFQEEIYDKISIDYINHYNSPSFLIELIHYFKGDEKNISTFLIEEFLLEIIKNRLYMSNDFIKENLNIIIELFFYKNINNSKKISYKIKEYFYQKLTQIKKYNLDLETFFLEFEEKLLSE